MADARAAGAGGALRILSANLANDRADAGAFAALVAAIAPDAVAVQELGPDQAEALARVMPFGALAPARDHHGMGIALRAPGAVRRLALPYRGAWVTEVQTSGGLEAVEVVNVHIAAPHVRPIRHRFRDRRGQVRQLLAYFEATPRARRVVLGDFNATPLWPTYRRLRARFDDAAWEAARRTGRRPQRTWGPWPGAPRLLRIDHVLVQGLRPATVRVLPLPGSDHSAIVVDLAGAAPATPGAG